MGRDDVGAQLEQEAGDRSHDARAVRTGNQQARGVAGRALWLGGPCLPWPRGHLRVPIARHALPSEPYFFPVLEVCPGVPEVSPAAGVEGVAPAFPVAPLVAVGLAAPAVTPT